MTTERGVPEPHTADRPDSVTIRDRYRIIGPGVARGETVVYDAEDAVTGRPLALSVVRGDAAADAEFVAAVREQAFRLAKADCRHPALIHVYDVGNTEEGELFVAVAPVRGRPLREVLAERGTLSFNDGLRLAIEVGEGLETLHRSGIVHGELRPESIVVVRDEHGREAARLVDTELTAAHRTSAGLRRRDEALFAYLAPEQIERAETTEAADIYALGLLVLELLTGHRPDGGGAHGAAEVPPTVARIVAKALEEGPGRRYSSITLMINDMWSAESATRPAPVHAGGPTRASSERRPSTRRRTLTDVGMAIALVVGLVLIGVTAWVVRAERHAGSGTPESEPVVAASPVAPAPAPRAAAPTPVVTPPTISAVPTEPASPPALPSPDVARTEPVRPAPVRAEVMKGRDERSPAAVAKPAAVSTAVGAPRPGARPTEPPAGANQPATTVGGDGTAIIDWLLKGRASD